MKVAKPTKAPFTFNGQDIHISSNIKNLSRLVEYLNREIPAYLAIDYDGALYLYEGLPSLTLDYNQEGDAVPTSYGVWANESDTCFEVAKLQVNWDYDCEWSTACIVVDWRPLKEWVDGLNS